MPQKKNPDIAELVRGKTGRVYGNLMAMLTIMKGQPLAYNKDNQEDKEPLFDSLDTVTDCVRAFAGMVPHIIPKRDNMREAAKAGFATATDLADYLVKKGVAFRDAHEIVGKTVGRDVCIGANSVIGDEVVLGDGVEIGAGVVIEDHVTIGNHTRIGHRVVIHHETEIGAHCSISEGAVIAGQGFGFSLEGGQWHAIPQIGRVMIGNHVHIGANSCIDRGAINDTVIGNYVIIDNLVHIAHNVRVGDGTAMAAGVGIAGSTVVGKYCLLAGQVGVVGHIRIADGVQVNGGARVLQSIKDSGVYAGSFHVQPVKKWNRMAVYLKRLEGLFKRETQ